jgi:hypothetical protein
VELVKGAGYAGQVEVIDYGFSHVTLYPPGSSGQTSSLTFRNVHGMFAACRAVLSGPEMGHTAGMARATHLHGRRNGWGTGAAVVLLGVLAASTPLCRAQESYPAKPVHLIVPSTAGGTTDIVGRALAQALSQRMISSMNGADGAPA